MISYSRCTRKRKHQCLNNRFHFALFLIYRYQYYLQVKKDVLDGRLRTSLEQGIRLAALAVQGTLFLCLPRISLEVKKLVVTYSLCLHNVSCCPISICWFVVLRAGQLDPLSKNIICFSTGLDKFCSLPKGSPCQIPFLWPSG